MESDTKPTFPGGGRSLDSCAGGEELGERRARWALEAGWAVDVPFWTATVVHREWPVQLPAARCATRLESETHLVLSLALPPTDTCTHVPNMPMLRTDMDMRAAGSAAKL